MVHRNSESDPGESPEERAGVSDRVLEPGRYRLRVTAPGYRPSETPVAVRAGHVEDAELSLERE